MVVLTKKLKLSGQDKSGEKTNKLISFYRDKYPANGKKNYYFNDIVNNWTDYQLEKSHDFIQWLFPDETGGVNSNAPKLTDKDIHVFKKDKKIRAKVISATIRMLLFYGYELQLGDRLAPKRVKDIERKEHNDYIGLYSKHNYRRITRIMTFLNKIEMFYLSVIFFWTMCEAMKKDSELRRRVNSVGAIPFWMATQNYLRKYKDGYDIDRMSFELPTESSWEEDIGGSSDDSASDYDGWIGEDVEYHWPGNSSEDEEYKGDEDVCDRIRGLDYTGNSCYQDSVLLATFAIPNDVITDYILAKNVHDVSNLRHRWTVCDENKETDYIRRKNVQDEIIRITNSMRKVDSPVRHCSKLRKLIRMCPGTEEFHSLEMQDAGEFLSYLFNLFQVDVAKTSHATYVTNDMGPNPTWTLVDKVVDDNYASPIIGVSSFHIQSKDPKYINNFLVQTEDAVFDDKNLFRYDKTLWRRRKTVWRMRESPYIVFYIHRLQRGQYREKTLYTPVIPVQRIGNLSLSAIVVHEHNHYTCYFNCKGIWFYYDDNPLGRHHFIRRVGNYDEMLRQNPSPVTNGTLYYYV